jgi:uncharacterized protein YhaN
MRFVRLELLRFGHLTDVVLDFPPDVGLHVVHGANEAGKSTALAAIADGLFGFQGKTTPFAFLHPMPNLRIGFTLEASNGTRHAFVRRKGNKDTLLDPAGQAVQEATLRALLGGVERGRFLADFGLTATVLRQGGEKLARASGSAAETVLAGLGLDHLPAALDRLEQEAGQLFGDRRGTRRLRAAIDAYQAARSARDQAVVRPAAWLAATREVEQIGREQEAARERHDELQREQRRLNRVLRVRPLLVQLDAAHSALEQFGAVASFPADAEQRCETALNALASAKRDLEREQQAAADLERQHGELRRDPDVLAEQDTIEAIHDRRGEAAAALRDLPEQKEAVAAHRAKVAEACRDIDPAIAPEVLRERVPAHRSRDRARRLLTDRAKQATAVEAAASALAAAEKERADAASALARAATPPDFLGALQVALDQVRGEGKLDDAVTSSALALSRAEAATRQALSRLPLWQRDAAALAAAPLPLSAAAAETGKMLDAATEAVANAQGARVACERDIARLADELGALDRDLQAGGEAVPTRERIAGVRSERDHAWRLIRRAMEGGPAADERERAGLPEGPLADAFEGLRDTADRLADRRADDAQRVATFEACTAQLARQRKALAEADEAVAMADRKHGDVARGWVRLWAPAGIEPQTPAAMQDWRRQRDEVLKLHAAEAEAGEALQQAEARRRQARATLRAFLPAAGADETLAALIARADNLVREGEKAAGERRKLQDRIDRIDDSLPDMRAKLSKAEGRLGELDAELTSAAAAISGGANVSVDSIEAVLSAWEVIAEAAEPWRVAAQRVADIQAAVDAFTRDAHALAARLPDEATDASPQLAVARLKRRLDEARATEARAEDLRRRIDGHRDAAITAGRHADDAQQTLDALHAFAGTADDLQLREAIRRARRRAELDDTIAELGRQLLEQGEGKPEAELRGEASGQDPDTAGVRISEIGDELAELGHERERLGGAARDAKANLAALETGHAAADHAQGEQNALADARDAAERYARIHLARSLLRVAIGRLREQRQDTLLEAAGWNFSRLTRGRYVALRSDEDDAGQPVVHAIAADDSTCPMAALSEGTRDQLFLAMRLAAIAREAAAHPMPLIADDLLVNFDDARAAAALDMLAEFGATTQVILFTHHDHIVELAQGRTGVAILRLPPLPAAAGRAA